MLLTWVQLGLVCPVLVAAWEQMEALLQRGLQMREDTVSNQHPHTVTSGMSLGDEAHN